MIPLVLDSDHLRVTVGTNIGEGDSTFPVAVTVAAQDTTHVVWFLLDPWLARDVAKLLMNCADVVEAALHGQRGTT